MTRLLSQRAWPRAMVVAYLALHPHAVAEGARVSSFGGNLYGQAGLGMSVGDQYVVRPIDTTNLGGRAITQVAAGFWHSLLLAEDGSVFSFGGGIYSGNGIGNKTLVATPIDASNLGGRKIMQIAAGAIHSLLLAEDGSVFSFGNNSDGRVGLGSAVSGALVATPIENPRHSTFTYVAAGLGHSLVIGVPEPGSLALVTVALVGFLGKVRRPDERQETGGRMKL